MTDYGQNVRNLIIDGSFTSQLIISYRYIKQNVSIYILQNNRTDKKYGIKIYPDSNKQIYQRKNEYGYS